MKKADQMYYYAEPGSQICGPLALGSIRAAQAAGKLSSAVKVSQQAGGPWLDLATPKRVAVTKLPFTVAGYFDGIAMCLIAVGFIALGVGIYYVFNSDRAAILYIQGGVGSLLTGLGIWATAELLYRLRTIAEYLRVLSERPE